MNKIGFIGIARETFDIALAAQTAKLAHKRLRELGFVVIGDDSPLTDAASTQAAARRVLAVARSRCLSHNLLLPMPMRYALLLRKPARLCFCGLFRKRAAVGGCG